MRHGDIDQKEPEQGEQHDRAKAHALDKGADDQRGRDDGEGHLEHEEYGLGERGARRHLIARNADEQHLGEIADKGPPPLKARL